MEYLKLILNASIFIIILILVFLVFLDLHFSRRLTKIERVESYFEEHGIQVKYIHSIIDENLLRYLIYADDQTPLLIIISASKRFTKHISIRCYSYKKSHLINEVLEASLQGDIPKSKGRELLNTYDEVEVGEDHCFFLYPDIEEFKEIINNFSKNNDGLLVRSDVLEKYEKLYDKLLALF